jgi:hypothetical protein
MLFAIQGGPTVRSDPDERIDFWASLPFLCIHQPSLRTILGASGFRLVGNRSIALHFEGALMVQPSLGPAGAAAGI